MQLVELPVYMTAQQHQEGLWGAPHPFLGNAEEEMLLGSTQHPMFLWDFAEGATDVCRPGGTEAPHVLNARQLLGPLRASEAGRRLEKGARRAAALLGVRTAKRSEEAPRGIAAIERRMRRGQRDSISSTKDTSAWGMSGARPRDVYHQYHWHRSDAGNRPAPQPYSSRGPGPNQRCSGGVEQRRQREAGSHGEQRRACRPECSVGPSHSPETDGSVEFMPRNELDSSMGSTRATRRPPGAAPWPENIPDGRQPVWAVPGKDWLVLLPNAVEPMELGPQGEVEEAMEVDPPQPDQIWDYAGRSLLRAVRELHQLRSGARRAPYSLSRRLHPRH
ncbi:hypothetical protein Anapl_13823 [Anas platyrhynchos]|uniref:Uncharacterized protein n=1 Tax=Anas platyrhynchos TaxID=8839 RepID=R0L7Z1_ANAPL|nr:hypothetical protein Anapl_13823 [Anas platyrhynchos]